MGKMVAAGNSGPAKRQISALCLCLFAGAGECLARLLSRNECIDIQARIRGARSPTRASPSDVRDEPAILSPVRQRAVHERAAARLLPRQAAGLEGRHSARKQGDAGHLQDENNVLPDLVDRASTETDRALELRTRDRQRKLIAKIDAALERIDNGSYGYCEETGDRSRCAGSTPAPSPRCRSRRRSVMNDANGSIATTEVFVTPPKALSCSHSFSQFPTFRHVWTFPRMQY